MNKNHNLRQTINKLDPKKLKDKIKSQTDVKTEDECWLWKGYKNQKGYGRLAVAVDKKVIRLGVHRLVYLLTYDVDPEGQFVCHKCDNPSCINPKHLFLGTAKDNNNDAFLKERNAPVGIYVKKGENNHSAKYTAVMVQEMRKLHKEGKSVSEIAKLFNVSRGGVYNVVKEVTWKLDGDV